MAHLALPVGSTADRTRERVRLVVTAKIGGNAMEWHLRLGHVVLALLVFRVVWGVVGGRWRPRQPCKRKTVRRPPAPRGDGNTPIRQHANTGHAPNVR